MSERKRKKSPGYYARILGTFWRHPRTCGLSMAARGLWVTLLSWCADGMTDGAIPEAAFMLVTAGVPMKRERAELEAAALLTPAGAPNTWSLRDWSQHNITKDEYESEKERARNGMRAARAGSAPVTRNEPATRGSPSDQDQDQDQSLPSGASRAHEAPARVPLPEADPVSSALRVGYQRRYQAQTGDAWLTSAAADGPIKRAAAWCRAQPTPLEAVERFLDGAFAHGSWRAHRWPWKFLAEDPALTASRSSIAVGTMGEHPTLDDAMRARLASVPTYEPTGEEIPF